MPDACNASTRHMAKQIQLKPTLELLLKAVPEVDCSLNVPGVFEQGFVKDELGFGSESEADDTTGLQNQQASSRNSSFNPLVRACAA